MAAAPAPQTSSTPTPTPEDTPLYGMYPYTSYQFLTEEDLRPFDCNELALMRNEIYARHGRRFSNPHLNKYFRAQDWYQVDPHYSDSRLSTLEKANAITIRNYEKKMGCL